MEDAQHDWIHPSCLQWFKTSKNHGANQTGQTHQIESTPQDEIPDFQPKKQEVPTSWCNLVIIVELS